MKNLLFTLVSFSVLLLIGCQENSITDPLTNDLLSKNQDPAPYQQGFISLEGMLSDPYPVMNSYYIISGEIEYEHRLVSGNFVSLSFLTTADFQYLCTVCSPSEMVEQVGFISDYSEDYILLTGGSAILEKTFLIQGRDDQMVLVCQFLVTADGIELNSRWLELSDDPTTNELNKNVGPEPVTYPPVVNNQIN